MSKWDILDAFHRCNLHLSDFGKFIYVVPTLPADPSVLPCINMVLPMVWLNSPDFFCATSETVRRGCCAVGGLVRPSRVGGGA